MPRSKADGYTEGRSSKYVWYLQVSVASVAERVAEIKVVEDQLNPLCVCAAEIKVARDVRRIRIWIQRRVERSADRLLTVVLHPARGIYRTSAVCVTAMLSVSACLPVCSSVRHTPALC